MEKEKHTPGPWRVGRWSQSATISGNVHTILNSDGYHTAFVPGWDGPGAGEKAPEESRANAHLIAAAPELLEALGFTVEVFGDQEGLRFSQRHAINKARAAIAKARGGEG